MQNKKKQSGKGKKEAAKQKDKVASLAFQYLNRCVTQKTPDMEPYLAACPSLKLQREFRICVAMGLLCRAAFVRKRFGS